MSGITVRLCQRIDIVITGPSATTVIQYPLARRIDASQFQHGVIVARLHTSTSFVTGQNVQISYGADPFTEEDPSPNWAGVASTTTTLFTGGTDTGPAVKTVNLAEPFPNLLMFAWVFNFTVTTQMKISLSADLQLKGN